MLSLVQDCHVFWGALPPDFEHDVMPRFGLTRVRDTTAVETLEAIKGAAIV